MKTFLESDLTFKEYLEARRNPELNPKISAYEALLPYKDDPDIYISFTEIEKIGINPRSKYSTPLGIYCYPIKEAWEAYKFDRTKSPGQSVPFAGDAPFIWIMRKKKDANFVEDLYTTYTSKDYDMDIKKLKQFVIKEEIYSTVNYFTGINDELYLDMRSDTVDLFGAKRQNPSLEEVVDVLYKYFDIPEFKVAYRDKRSFQTALLKTLNDFNFELKDLNDTQIFFKVIYLLDERSLLSIENLADNARSEARFKSPSGIMWNLTRLLANISASQLNSKPPIQWNVILRKALGYQGVADKSGRGIIHPSEPLQAVFFSTKGFDVVNKVLNKDYEVDQSHLHPTWLKDASTKNMNVEVDENGRVTWEDGKWIQGTWENGTWKDGLWRNGVWKNGIWMNGEWEVGVWENGIWMNGEWKEGKWEDGLWNNGLWLDGKWKNGKWKDGTWKDGTWEKGEIFDPELKAFVPSKVSPKEYFENKESR